MFCVFISIMHGREENWCFPAGSLCKASNAGSKLRNTPQAGIHNIERTWESILHQTLGRGGKATSLSLIMDLNSGHIIFGVNIMMWNQQL